MRDEYRASMGTRPAARDSQRPGPRLQASDSRRRSPRVVEVNAPPRSPHANVRRPGPVTGRNEPRASSGARGGIGVEPREARLSSLGGRGRAFLLPSRPRPLTANAERGATNMTSEHDQPFDSLPPEE